MSMPVLVSFGGGIVAKRVAAGRDVMLMRPSWTPGTATRTEACAECSDEEAFSWFGDDGGIWHMAKEQKFSALTSKECRSHGCFLSVVASSIGSTVEKVFSSASRSCHTRSLLSRPCLRGPSQLFRSPASITQLTYVMMFSSSIPQLLTPSTDPPCAFQTATGRLATKFHSTTQPSASPVRRRRFCRKKCTQCIWAVWPRRT
jgi:hypothetical protein